MATNFPGSLDSFTNPTSSSTLDSPSHAGQHANINDAVEAVQAKLGTGAGTIGEWTTFTPSWTNLTVGNGTQSFVYAQVNDVVFVQGRLTFGTTTAFTSTFIRMASPVSTFAGNMLGHVLLREASVATRIGVIQESGNEALIQYHSVAGSVVNAANVNATNPFTWGNGDYIMITLCARLT